MADQSLIRSYRSFSGTDIIATFGGTVVGTLQGVSFTVTREKAPQYVMGRTDPLSFSRGKRGIAGSLIFLVFDRTNLLAELKRQFYADRADLSGFVGKYLDDNVVGALPRDERNDLPAALEAANLNVPGGVVGGVVLERGSIARPSEPWYHDQIPPFDIVLTSATEYGQISRMAIHGVEILNAGSGISIDDITTDENMTFVARQITPWHSLSTPGETLPGQIQYGEAPGPR